MRCTVCGPELKPTRTDPPFKVVMGDVGAFLTFHIQSLLHQHSPSACPCRAARWTDSGRRPSLRASARPLRSNL